MWNHATPVGSNPTQHHGKLTKMKAAAGAHPLAPQAKQSSLVALGGVMVLGHATLTTLHVAKPPQTSNKHQVAGMCHCWLVMLPYFHSKDLNG